MDYEKHVKNTETSKSHILSALLWAAVHDPNHSNILIIMIKPNAGNFIANILMDFRNMRKKKKKT